MNHKEIGVVKAAFAAIALALAANAGAVPAIAQPAEGTHRIGFLTAGSERAFAQRMAAFRDGLGKLGYRVGENVSIEARYAAGRRKRLPGLAAELVELGVDIVLTNGGSATRLVDRAAKRAGRAVPIVFAIAPDPVGAGLVASLARPGGNVTGLSIANTILVPKRLALIKETLPSAARIAVLYSARAPSGPVQLRILKAVARDLGVTLIPVAFDTPDQFERAVAALGRIRLDALDVLGSSLTNGFRKRIAARATALRLPTMFSNARGAAAGGLMSYGADAVDNYRRAATYVDKILKGARPAELPVEQPTRFELTVNLKTAKALGITIPRSILLRADKLIE